MSIMYWKSQHMLIFIFSANHYNKAQKGKKYSILPVQEKLKSPEVSFSDIFVIHTYINHLSVFFFLNG